jgi:hypothetical protein
MLDIYIYIYRYIDEISHYNTYYFLYDMPNACYSPDILLADSSRISELPAHCLPARCGSEQYSIKLWWDLVGHRNCPWDLIGNIMGQW